VKQATERQFDVRLVSRMVDQAAIDDLVFTATIDLYTAWRDEQESGSGEYPT
jgi:hypothetical protein